MAGIPKPVAQQEPQAPDFPILTSIQDLDLTGKVTFGSEQAVSFGGFSEIFRGYYWWTTFAITVTVAIKRLRFHVKNGDYKRVRQYHSVDASLFDVFASCLNRRSTSGQSSYIPTSCP